VSATPISSFFVVNIYGYRWSAKHTFAYSPLALLNFSDFSHLLYSKRPFPWCQSLSSNFIFSAPDMTEITGTAT
jgi:hypothetical protein